jgi:hypothetical protein
MIVDLETDISTSPALVEMLIESEDCRILYSAMSSYKWFKLRDVTKSEDEQVVEILTVDRNDTARMWKCSSSYADDAVNYLRYHHHQLAVEHVYSYGHKVDIPDHVIALFHDIGWVPVIKTADDW